MSASQPVQPTEDIWQCSVHTYKHTPRSRTCTVLTRAADYVYYPHDVRNVRNVCNVLAWRTKCH